MAPSPWNDATDCQLLLTIIHLTTPQLPNWTTVAEMMGKDFTAESVRQHFQKMRKASAKEFGDPEATAKTAPTRAPKGTPRKGKATAAGAEAPGKSTGKRKGKKDADADADDQESPSKKRAIKTEDDDENGDS